MNIYVHYTYGSCFSSYAFLHTFFAPTTSDFLQEYDELSFISPSSSSSSDQVDVDLTSDLFVAIIGLDDETAEKEYDNGLIFDQIDQDSLASVSLDSDFLADEGNACSSSELLKKARKWKILFIKTFVQRVRLESRRLSQQGSSFRFHHAKSPFPQK